MNKQTTKKKVAVVNKRKKVAKKKAIKLSSVETTPAIQKELQQAYQEEQNGSSLKDNQNIIPMLLDSLEAEAKAFYFSNETLEQCCDEIQSHGKACGPSMGEKHPEAQLFTIVERLQHIGALIRKERIKLDEHINFLKHTL